ncbi:suppressor of cytokine signaling 1-like [Geospiza fortis]|uniref:Suppressor of cytokine signaling 1-like n=5 Tax=Neognathae TaxID=8825 RepID=A0A6I9HHT8_GEOFO|nr:suppressor of cytokine signaling 1-like [Geospiza fortis]XP_030816019.1 suppressor of cytokine signaling 1-like [Camarhynchus parvulus]XP_030816020.1 suppressor of cytokine signaling 1-like [Camarhynchus parvulus]XP_030913602.1 suppressor of cytokine signaling 1-like [Geospiza fortis]
MIRGRPDDLHNTQSTVSPLQRQHRSVLPSPAPPGLPDRFRMFRSCEWEILERSLNILQASDFYWGPLSVGEAHAKLQREPVGTYLVRDSSQGNCLFSLSVRMPTGPVSLRISFQEGYFRLKNWFSDCVVRLLELVVAGTRNNPLHFDEMGGTPLVFSEPLCRSRRAVPTLRELCCRNLPAGAATEDRAGLGDSLGTCLREEVFSPLDRKGGSEGSIGPSPSLSWARR